MFESLLEPLLKTCRISKGTYDKNMEELKIIEL